MSIINEQSVVSWKVEKYEIQLNLFRNKEATDFALLQWTPSNAREESDYNEMQSRFRKNPIMKLCANDENEVIINDYNSNYFDSNTIVFEKNAEFSDGASDQNLYLYEKKEATDADKYSLYIKYKRNMNDGEHSGIIELCELTVCSEKAIVRIGDNEYIVKYTKEVS